MHKLIFLLPLANATTCGNAPDLTTDEPKTVVAMLPARTLDCTLGRALNLDPTRNQSLNEIRYEGAHPFSLYLPSVPKRQTPPPDPDEAPEPVDPKTRILADPAGLASGENSAFSRVIDMWPDRVEIARPIDHNLTRLIIVSEIDTENGTANLFMAQAADAASLDMNKVFQGSCRVKSRVAADEKTK